MYCDNKSLLVTTNEPDVALLYFGRTSGQRDVGKTRDPRFSGFRSSEQTHRTLIGPRSGGDERQKQPKMLTAVRFLKVTPSTDFHVQTTTSNVNHMGVPWPDM